jgi:hypothetical protein
VKDKALRFFIIGAPKCGTSSLASWLAEHPSVFMSPLKEPHYYSVDLANRAVRSAAQYAALFKSAGCQHVALGEASTWYLYSQAAIPAIEREHPDARYIVMTRDPVAMAHSLHHHNLRVLHEDQPDFETAWNMQPERALGQLIPKTCVEPSFLQYHKACRLGSMVNRLLDIVPAERIFHVALESMQAYPGRVYRSTLEFLGVPDDNRSEFPLFNPARGHRSRLLQETIRAGARVKRRLGFVRAFGLAQLNEIRLPKARLTPEFVNRLEAAFADEIYQLNETLKKMGKESGSGL